MTLVYNTPLPQCRHSLEVWFIYLYVICYNFCFSWNGCKNKLLLWCFREQYSLLISRHLRLENFKCFTLSIWCVWWEGMETDLAANIWQISYHTIWILTFRTIDRKFLDIRSGHVLFVFGWLSIILYSYRIFFIFF